MLSENKERLYIYNTEALVFNINYDKEFLSWDGGTSLPEHTAGGQLGLIEDEIGEILGIIDEDLINKIVIVNGELFVKSTISEKEKQWAIEIGVLDNIEKTEILELKNGSIDNFCGSLDISVENNIITLDGPAPTGKNTFIKISKTELLAKNNKSEIPNGVDTFSTGEKKLAYIVEPISGTYEGTIGNPNACQFNILLKDNVNADGIFKIDMINSSNRISSGRTENDILYAYIFIKGDAVFSNFKFKLSLLEDVSEDVEVVVSDRLHLITSQKYEIASNPNNYIMINADGTITLNGKLTNGKDKAFIKLNNGIEMNEITGLFNDSWKGVDCQTLIDSGVMIRLIGEEISGSYETVGLTNQFNIALRYELDNSGDGYDGAQAIGYKFLSPSDPQNGVSVGLQKDVKCFYIYVNKNITFNNYTIKPILEIIE